MENQVASSPSAAKPSLFRRLLNVNTQSSACCWYKLCMHDGYSTLGLKTERRKGGCVMVGTRMAGSDRSTLNEQEKRKSDERNNKKKNEDTKLL